MNLTLWIKQDWETMSMMYIENTDVKFGQFLPWQFNLQKISWEYNLKVQSLLPPFSEFLSEISSLFNWNVTFFVFDLTLFEFLLTLFEFLRVKYLTLTNRKLLGLKVASVWAVLHKLLHYCQWTLDLFCLIIWCNFIIVALPLVSAPAFWLCVHRCC